MVRLPSLVIVLLLAVALAGCVSEKPEPSGSAGPEVSPSTGAVRGTVLTADLEPVPNALVGLVQEGQVAHETRTDADGAFAIGRVSPGEYLLQVTGLCCRASVKKVEVRADEHTQADVQLIKLDADDLQIASVTENEWHGFISCGISTPAVSGALCSITEGTAAEDPNEDFMLQFNVSRGIRSLVVGMVWTPVGGISAPEFNLVVENDDCVFDSCSYEYADVTGASPIVVHLDEAAITDPEYAWSKVDPQRGMQFRIFAGGAASVVYQQPFSIYFHEFSWEPAPDAYNPVPDA